MRADLAWREGVAETGRWDEPAYWKDPAYLAQSPLTAAELDNVFGTLLRIYSPERVRAIFRRGDPALMPLLTAPFSALFNRLVALGEDAHACEAWNQKSIVDALVADGRSFEGAFFEVTFFAALRRLHVRCEYEPLAIRPDGTPRKKGDPNPDFAAEIGGGDLLLELKSSRESAESRDLSKRLYTLATAGEGTTDIPFEIELLPAFRDMLERDGGWELRARFKTIVANVEAAKKQLACSAGPFPISEVIDGCVQLKVRGARGSGPSGGVMGPRPNFVREAQRIVRGLVADGATVIPDDRPGVIVVEPGLYVDEEFLAPEIRRWFAEEGSAYPQVLGVAIVSKQFALDFELERTLVTPVWRDSAPIEVRESDVWDRLSLALSLRQMRAYEFRTGRSVLSLLAG